MKKDTATAQTVGLPRQSVATVKNISKLQTYFSKNGKTRQSTKKLGK